MDPKRKELHHIEALRTWRVWKERDVTTSRAFRDFAREQTRLARALGAVCETFESIVPIVIANECRLVGLRSGVLTVETRSASCQYALGRFLRAGGEAALRAASEVTGQSITKVRVVCHHD